MTPPDGLDEPTLTRHGLRHRVTGWTREGDDVAETTACGRTLPVVDDEPDLDAVDCPACAR